MNEGVHIEREQERGTGGKSVIPCRHDPWVDATAGRGVSSSGPSIGYVPST